MMTVMWYLTALPQYLSGTGSWYQMLIHLNLNLITTVCVQYWKLIRSGTRSMLMYYKFEAIAICVSECQAVEAGIRR